MSSDEEIDYMSEAFLTECVEKNDIRPGLLHSHTAKRKHNLEKKKNVLDDNYRKKMRPIKEIQEEKLKEGLNTPLDSSNKGFALMQKMGYTAGMSLGKQGTGIVEPVTVNLKSDRIGLGWQVLLAEKRKKLEERRRSKKSKEMNIDEYRAHKSNEHNKKLIEVDLNKSRKSCYELDLKKSLDPPEFWFWPKHTWETEEDSGEEDCDEEEEIENEKSIAANSNSNSQKDESQQLYEDLESSDQLQIINSYLRSTHLYCIWCCIEYENNSDIEKNCPGTTRGDHD